MTAVVSVSELLDPLLSVVELLTVAVLLIVTPVGVPAVTLTTKVNVAEAPAASVAIVAVTVPVPPAGGVVSVNAGPDVCIADTNVVLAGTTSLSVTPCASLG